MEKIFYSVLNAVHETQGVKPKVHKIEVKEAVRTPTGMVIYLPVKKVKSMRAIGLVADEEASNE